MAELTTLQSLLIGGALGIAGTIVSQAFGLFSGSVERHHQTELRKKQRLEKMVELVSESLAWFHTLLQCRNIQHYKEAHPPVQIRLVVMLARLSFPSIVEPAKQWAQGCLDYYAFVGECYDPNIPASMGAQLVLAVQNNPKLKPREENILVLRNKLDDAIAEEAKKYLNV
jgi:hypothetical protein